MVSLPAALMSFAILGAGNTVLLDFHADWCGPCRAMGPTVQALEAKGYPVRKVNVDRERALAQQHGVTSLPSFVMLVDGREVGRIVGGASLAELEQMCQLASRRGGSEAVCAPNRPPVDLAKTAPSGPDPRNVLPAAAILPARKPNSPGTAVERLPDMQAEAPSWASRPMDDEQLIATTVRLRIQDPQGHSSGTGTLIDARSGEALILTCGHIFRDSKGQGRIEVDLFGPRASQRIPGRLVKYDMKTDVGLVAIRVPEPVVAARVAPPGHQLERGQSVISVGCDNGADPTARHSRVSSLNKFLGPANVQVAGQPVEGRSGGGLFSPEGLVVGVCNAADPQDQEGLFAAAECIHAILNQAGLAYVYNPAESGSGTPATPRNPLVPTEGESLANLTPPATNQPANRDSLEEIQWPSAARGTPVRTVAATQEDLPSLDRDEQAALSEIRRRLDDGYEVVCIVRPRNDPQAKSEVLVLDRVSPTLLQHLETAAQTAERPRFTSSRQ